MTLDFVIIPSPHGGYIVKYGTGHEVSASVQEVVMWELLKEKTEAIEDLEERIEALEGELNEIQRTLLDE